MQEIAVFERLKAVLRSAGIDFTVTHHAPVYTSAEAAAVRGVSLHSGAKALVLKGEDALPAAFVARVASGAPPLCGGRLMSVAPRGSNFGDQIDELRYPFFMAVMPADLGLDSNALRKFLGAKRMRFATKEEVLELTGLTPGSIPPFGSLFGLHTICDTRLAENERINFNAGSHTDSIQMTYADYLAYESPVLAEIAKPAA